MKKSRRRPAAPARKRRARRPLTRGNAAVAQAAAVDFLERDVASFRAQVAEADRSLDVAIREFLATRRPGPWRDLAHKALKALTRGDDVRAANLLREANRLQVTAAVRRGARFRGGKGGGHVAWHAVVRAIVAELVEQRRDPSSQEIVNRLLARARDADDVVDKLVRTDRTSCDRLGEVSGIVCPPQYHLHFRQGARLRAVALKTIQNYAARLKPAARSPR